MGFAIETVCCLFDDSRIHMIMTCVGTIICDIIEYIDIITKSMEKITHNQHFPKLKAIILNRMQQVVHSRKTSEVIL